MRDRREMRYVRAAAAVWRMTRVVDMVGTRVFRRAHGSCWIDCRGLVELMVCVVAAIHLYLSFEFGRLFPQPRTNHVRAVAVQPVLVRVCKHAEQLDGAVVP